MAPQWIKEMKARDWIDAGQLGTSLIGGIADAGARQRDAEQIEFDRQRLARQDEFNRQLQYYAMQQQARSGLGAFWNQTNVDRARGRQAFLDASPLGAEQELAYRMARARGLSDVAENFQPLTPASGDIAGLIRPTTNMLRAFTTPDFRQAISPEATARSIAERRKALAGVDPTFQFGSMGDYGIPNLEKEVATYAQGVAADRLSRENQLQNLLIQQANAATAFPKTVADAQGLGGTQELPPNQSVKDQKPKKSSWWKKVLNVAATAAPIVAAPFTGGTSLALIGAGAGAVKGALSGGAKGALTGAAIGAGTSALGGGPAGATAARGMAGAVKESASSAIKRAILNPRALTQLGGAAVGGRTEQLAQLAAPFLQGAKAFNPNAAYTRGLPVDAVIPAPRDFTADVLKQAGMGAGQAQNVKSGDYFGKYNVFGPHPEPFSRVKPTFPGSNVPALTPPSVSPGANQSINLNDIVKAASAQGYPGQGYEGFNPRVSNISPLSSFGKNIPVGSVNFTSSAQVQPQKNFLDQLYTVLTRRQGQGYEQGGLGSPGATLSPADRQYLQTAQTLVNAAPLATATALGLPFAPATAPTLAGRVTAALRGPSPIALELSKLMAEVAAGNASPQRIKQLSEIVARMPGNTAEILQKLPPSVRLQILRSLGGRAR